jgi:hypothetical protein
MNIYTVGYEGVALEEFLLQLRRAWVQTIVDVRDVPLSRKRGFSKTVQPVAVAEEHRLTGSVCPLDAKCRKFRACHFAPLLVD